MKSLFARTQYQIFIVYFNSSQLNCNCFFFDLVKKKKIQLTTTIKNNKSMITIKNIIFENTELSVFANKLFIYSLNGLNRADLDLLDAVHDEHVLQILHGSVHPVVEGRRPLGELQVQLINRLPQFFYTLEDERKQSARDSYKSFPFLHM